MFYMYMYETCVTAAFEVLLVKKILLVGLHTQPSHLNCQKYVGKRKGAVNMTVLKMCITCKHKCGQNVCELWITECALFRLES